jgi:hypothetical protein
MSSRFLVGDGAVVVVVGDLYGRFRSENDEVFHDHFVSEKEVRNYPLWKAPTEDRRIQFRYAVFEPGIPLLSYVLSYL